MPKVIFLPLRIEVSASKGKSILDLAFENDIVIEHNCGGLCACTSCRVFIVKGLHMLSAKSEDEYIILSEAGFLNDGDRLSCRCFIEIDIEDEIIVEIPQ